MAITGKANPKDNPSVLDDAGVGVPVYLDHSVPAGELHLYDDAGTFIKSVKLGGVSGGAGGNNARHKPR